MTIQRKLRRFFSPTSVGVGLMLLGVPSLCWAGGLDWLLPPLRTPCPTETTHPVRISIQTTYTPRLPGGLWGGGGEIIPGPIGPGSSFGMNWGRGTAPPVILTPINGGLLQGCPATGPAYLCVPYVLPSSADAYGRGLGSGVCPSMILLPGQVPNAFPGGPSSVWHPVVETGPPVVPSGSTGSFPADAPIPFFPLGGQPSLGIPLLPAPPAKPSPNGSAANVSEKGENSFGKNPGDNASTSADTGEPKASEPNSRPLVPIPEESFPLPAVPSGANLPLNPPKQNPSPSLPSQELQNLPPPSFTPLRRSGSVF